MEVQHIDPNCWAEYNPCVHTTWFFERNKSTGYLDYLDLRKRQVCKNVDIILRVFIEHKYLNLFPEYEIEIYLDKNVSSKSSEYLFLNTSRTRKLLQHAIQLLDNARSILNSYTTFGSSVLQSLFLFSHQQFVWRAFLYLYTNLCSWKSTSTKITAYVSIRNFHWSAIARNINEWSSSAKIIAKRLPSNKHFKTGKWRIEPTECRVQYWISLMRGGTGSRQERRYRSW